MARNLFRARANYVFDYTPRYYDERKERLERLEDKYSKEKNKDKNVASSTISASNLRKEWKRNKHVAHDRATNLRLAIIISLLVGIVAYIFDLHKLF